MQIGIECYRDPFALYLLEDKHPERLEQLLGYLHHSGRLTFERKPQRRQGWEPVNTLPVNSTGTPEALERARRFLD